MFLFFIFFISLSHATLKPTSVLLVDKKKNQLHLAEYQADSYQIQKTYHVTLGQVQGDKEDENDLKTPEGIYILTSVLKPPQLQKKFGVMAFPMNFPNAFDQLAGRTGSGIMLHATNEPERLKKNYDSEGCIVVQNAELQEIAPSIRLGLTPIIIFQELTSEWMYPGQDQRLKDFFNRWLQSWQNKQINHYIDCYHSDFSNQKKDKSFWKLYKSQLNERYDRISVIPEDVHYYRHPKYAVITFIQNYQSQLKSGRWGHRSRGTKVLVIAEEAGELKIISEHYTQSMW